MLTRRDFTKSVLGTGTGLLVGNEAWAAAEPLVPAGEPAGEPAGQSSGEASDQQCDLLVKGGTVVDPGQHLHAPMDVAVKDGKILEVSKDIPESRARKVLSAKDKIVTPGLIDLHVHCFEGAGEGMNADHYCVTRGVTTVVDAGSTGDYEIELFVKHIIRHSYTRIYPLLNIKATGTTANPIKVRSANGKVERDIPDWGRPEITAKAAVQYKPYVVGIKCRMGEDVQGPNADDLATFRMAMKAAQMASMPVMAHLDELYSPLPEFLKDMRKGDVFTHFLNKHKNGVLDANGKILPEVLDARQRGVLFDVGHGMKPGRVSFDVADKCFQQGFLPDTISTDLHRGDEDTIVDLPTEVSMFMALGLDLDKAIECVTINAARSFDFGVQIGTLRPGYEADIAVFELQDGNFTFLDNAGGQRIGKQRLFNNFSICRGQMWINRI
jgi:dihydroorotase